MAVGAALALVVGVVLAAGPTLENSGAASSRSAGQRGDEVRSLAVIEATGGEWNGEAGTLTLTGVASSGIQFTDRPARQAKPSSVSQIIGTFFGEQAPPNAALEYEVTGSDDQVAVVELTNPVYTPDAASLRFDARLLQDPASDLRAGSALADFVLRQDGTTPPPSFEATTLFLDSTAESVQQLGPNDATDKGRDGDQFRMTFEGDVTKDEHHHILDVSCVFRTGGAKYNYVARDPSTPPSIFDAARFRVDEDQGAPGAITIDGTHLVRNDDFSGFPQHAWIVVRRPALDFDPKPQHYKVTLWCSQDQESAWVVAR